MSKLKLIIAENYLDYTDFLNFQLVEVDENNFALNVVSQSNSEAQLFLTRDVNALKTLIENSVNALLTQYNDTYLSSTKSSSSNVVPESKL